MNAVVERKATEVATVSDTATIMQVIDRAARDPNVDMDKMERLLQMHERIKATGAKAAYAAALAEMQPDLPTVAERGAIKNKAGGIQSRYALWEDIIAIISPILSAHGFALTFRTANADKMVTVTGVLSHRDGHSEETTLTLPIDASDFRNVVQSIGSSVSYGKRYTASALLNLRTGEVDDDGAGKPPPDLVNDKQVADLEALITEVGADRAKFLRYIKVASLAEVRADAFDSVVKALEAKRARQ